MLPATIDSPTSPSARIKDALLFTPTPKTGFLRRLGKVHTRPLLLEELARAEAWAVEEGWNPGCHDSRIFFKADPDSLIAAEVNGEPVGVVSAVNMTPEFGFAGFLVLAPAYRHSLYGWSLLHAALDRMGDRVIGADGQLEHLHSYSRYGFQPHYQTVSHHGVAPDKPLSWHANIEAAKNTPLAELVAYDAATFGVPRTGFLREWLLLPESISLVFREDGRIRGLGTARRCHLGVRIGPLQADEPDIAEALFLALAGFTPGAPIEIDCPETNPEASRLAQRMALQPGGVTARVYRGTPPVGIAHRLYGQMSFALG